jgi:hypothetical protein
MGKSFQDNDCVPRQGAEVKAATDVAVRKKAAVRRLGA